MVLVACPPPTTPMSALALPITAPHSTQLFRGLPWLSAACSRRWLGDRWFAFSSPPHNAPRISIVSSRLSQRLDLESWWFDLLRTAVLQADRPTALLPVVSGTAPAEFVTRAGQLFGIKLLSVSLPSHCEQPDEFPRDAATIQNWLETATHSSPEDHEQPPQLQLLVSPIIPGAPPDAWQDFRRAIPLADRLLFALATRIVVLRCRSGGHISQLIHHHLHDSARALIPLMVASDHQGRFPDVLVQRHAGWIPWHCIPADHTQSPANHPDNSVTPAPQTTPASPATPSQPPATTPCDSGPLLSPADWLCHWTRPALGPWPGETRLQYLDQLILGQPNSDRSAIATLLRILREARIRGSTDAIRGGFTVTAFTQVPLTEFRERRVFRLHRRRYDFEPWGIAIRRSALMALGARPVIYGTDELWPQLAPADQPFFQKISLDGSFNSVAEREWRLPGDLSLAHIAPQDLVAFVDTHTDAELIRQHGPWNVLVLPKSPSVSPPTTAHPPDASTPPQYPSPTQIHSHAPASPNPSAC